MAKLFLDPNDSLIHVASSMPVYGSTGAESVLIDAGATGVVIDANVERTDLAGATSSFTYQQAGNTLKIYSGSTLISTTTLQDDADGTNIRFTDGGVVAKLVGGVMTLGGATVSTTQGAVVPTTIDATQVSQAGTGAPATPTFSVAGAASVTEGNTATFTVTLSSAQGTAKTVNYTLEGTGGAVLGTDTGTAVPGTTGTLTFAAGETSKTITVPVTFDSTVETGEGLKVTLASPSTGTALGTVATVTTAIADPAAPTFTMTSDAVAGTPTLEGGVINLKVTPSGIVDKDTVLTVNLTGSVVGAITTTASPSDFNPNTQTFTFKAGTTAAQTMAVTVASDAIVEGIEGYKASLLDSAFTELTSVTGTINDSTVPGGTGQTYTFTTNVDNFAGGSGNDTFIGDAASIVTADQANGGDGTDTIKIYDAAAVSDVPTLSNIEIIELINSAISLDFSTTTALTSLSLDNATNATAYTIGAGVAATIKGMADGEAVTLTSTATDTTHDLTVTDMGTIAGAGVTVNADGAGVTTVNIAASGSVAAGTDSDIIIASTGTETTVNVTGSGDLALTTAASVLTMGASAYTGNLTYVSGATLAATSITTGSGNDTVTATAAVNYTINLGAGNDTLTTADAIGELTTADSIAGGDGTDTLAISSAEALNLDDGDTADAAVLAKITGFESLRIIDALGGDIALNNLGYNSLQVTTALAADRTITGVTSGFTFTSLLDAAAANDYIVTMTGATGAGTNSDTINVNLNADLTANDTMRAISFDLAGINIINISANDRVTTSNPDTDANAEEGYTVDLAGNTAANSANINTINVSGAMQVAYTVNAATTALSLYNASTATGEQEFTGAAFAGTQGITINTGSGADTIVGSGLADVISAGSGNDSITGGVGADSMTGGAGVDTFTFANTATGLPSATVFDTITDFTKGADIIDGPGVLTISQSATATSGVAAINSEGIASFNVADNTLALKLVAVAAAVEVATATTANDIAIFEHSGDSYVFITDATAGLSATDVLIKLTGVTGLTDSTITGGDLTIV